MKYNPPLLRLPSMKSGKIVDGCVADKKETPRKDVSVAIW